MIYIRPVSDLKNKFPEIEKLVNHGKPVFLTKNGYGSMVVMSIELFDELTQNTEQKLLEAECFTSSSDVRLDLNEVVENVRNNLNHEDVTEIISEQ